jgi:hypothetical protein
VIEGISGIGFIGFFVFMLSMGIAILRRARAVEAPTASGMRSTREGPLRSQSPVFTGVRYG